MKKESIICKDCKFSYSISETILKDILFDIKNLSKQENNNFEECLREITFDLFQGERLGVIGLNGSGKSSLLLALSGNLLMQGGDLVVKNNYQLLSEMGDVDSPLNTGYQIIESYYYMLHSFQEEKTKLPSKATYIKEVADFSELGNKLNQKFLTYSSGMKARLLYSLRAVSMNQYCLIDEILSVGDSYFTDKCIRNLRIKNNQTTGIYVSHDWSLLSKICSKFLWLENGQIVKYGNLKEVLGDYLTTYNNWLKDESCFMSFLDLEKGKHSLNKSDDLLKLNFNYKNAANLNSRVSVGLENISSDKGWEHILQSTWIDLKLNSKAEGSFKLNIPIPKQLMPSEYELALSFKWEDNNQIKRTYTYSWINKKSFTVTITK